LVFGEAFASTGAERRWLREHRSGAKTKPKAKILAGASSGAAISALLSVADRLPPRSEVAVILCDRGERYLDTVYSDHWVREHFGDQALQQEQTRQFIGLEGCSA